MSGRTGALPPSLRPWSHDLGELEPLKAILGRIHNERGHFRNINEEGLRAEIAAEEQGKEESQSDDEDEEEDQKDTKSKPEELQAARREMIGHVASAQNEALMALDFVSLLLSKDQPLPTMSPFLKQTIKPGTLGIDMWQEMQPNKEQEKTDGLLAKGQKMQSLQQSADSLLSAATRLETNVKRETEYWSQVLSISDRGWSVCRMPRERHNLGVRYGFSEALGEFGKRGLAALRADEEGQIVLDKGFGDDPKAIRVRVQDGLKINGESRLPIITDEFEITIEGRIRHARDSLYEEELFHEMMVESRPLLAYGVRMHGNTIHIPMSYSQNEEVNEQGLQQIVIDLLPLTEGASALVESRSEDTFAQAVALAVRLSLSHAHRERLQRRSEIPPPMSVKRKEASVAPTLGPILSILQHRAAREKLEQYLARITSLLKAASLGFSLSPLAWKAEGLDTTDSIHQLLSTLMKPMRSSSSLFLIADSAQGVHFTFDVETSLDAPDFGTRFIVTIPSEPLQCDFDKLEDAIEHVDSCIASAIAKRVSLSLLGWKLDERMATLTKPDDGLGGSKSIVVELDSGMRDGSEADAAFLSLALPDRQMKWVPGQDNPKPLQDFISDDINA